MKRLLVALILCVLFAAPAGIANAAPREVGIKVNGIAISSEIPPQVVAGRVVAPLRSICDALGATTAWNGEQRTVTIMKSGRIITIQIANMIAIVEGTPREMDVPPMLLDGYTLVPARFLAEALGADIKWSGADTTIEITVFDKRNNLSAVNVFNSAAASMNTARSYRFSGTARVSSSIQPASMGFDAIGIVTEMSGVFRAPNEIYEKVLISMGDDSDETVEIELYSDGSSYYQKDSKAGWSKLDDAIPGQLLGSETASDPSGIFAQLKKVPFAVVFGDDVKIDGRDHYTLCISPENISYKEYLVNISNEAIEAGSDASSDDILGSDELELFQNIFSELMKNMRIDIAYKMYIDKESLTVSGIVTRGSFKLWAEGQGTSITRADAAMDLSGTNEPVDIPNIKAELH